MDDMLGHWKGLAITEEEEDVLGIDEGMLEKGKGMRRFLVLAKILTRKPYSKEAFKRTMTSLWKTDGGVSARSLEYDIFLFTFNEEKDCRRILNMEPWHFDNALVLLKEIGENDSIVWGNWSMAKFWVQILNLPTSGMIKEIGEIIGRCFGQSIEVEADAEGRCNGHFMRIRVLLDTSKPLRRGARIRLGSKGDVVWVDVRYERLPDFCFGCGKIGHGFRECSDPATTTMVMSNSLPYGAWMRAGGGRRNSVVLRQQRADLPNEKVATSAATPVVTPASKSSQNLLISKSPGEKGTEVAGTILLQSNKEILPRTGTSRSSVDFGTDRVDADCLKITDVAANSTGDGVAKNPPFLPSGASNSDALKIGTLPPSGLVFSAGDTGTKLGSTKAKGWKRRRAQALSREGSRRYVITGTKPFMSVLKI